MLSVSVIAVIVVMVIIIITNIIRDCERESVLSTTTSVHSNNRSFRYKRIVNALLATDSGDCVSQCV